MILRVSLQLQLIMPITNTVVIEFCSNLSHCEIIIVVVYFRKRLNVEVDAVLSLLPCIELFAVFLVAFCVVLTTLCMLLGKCDTFGEEMRLSRKRHTTGDPDEYTSGYGVQALSYCDLHTITLADLMAVLDDYPEFADDFLRQFIVTFSIQREVRSRGYVE